MTSSPAICRSTPKPAYAVGYEAPWIPGSSLRTAPE
jgi:hypothetical protein